MEQWDYSKFNVNPKKRIDWFFHHSQYFFLCNFFPHPQEVEGRLYMTNEHFFAASKAETWEVHDTIRAERGPRNAKILGRKIKLREDWEEVKDKIMLQGLRAKFVYPELAEKLLATDKARLIEGNSWHDTYWGQDAKTWEGENMLGKLLMQVRKELKNGKLAVG